MERQPKPTERPPLLPAPGEFVLDRKRQQIDIKSAVMEYAALERGLSVTRCNRMVIIAEHDYHQLAFRKMNGIRSSHVGRFFCDQKEQARARLTAAGLVATPSRIFRRKEQASAWKYAQNLGAEVVVKPSSMARGKGVTTRIRNFEQFTAAWERAVTAYRSPIGAKVLVEKQISGEDYRFYAIGDKTVFCTHRRRANVTGDAKSSLIELIEAKNALRSQNPYLGDYLIPTSSTELDRLASSGWTLNYVPSEGEVVELRGASNLSAGGDSIDCTEVMHPDYRDIVIRAVEAIPGMEYAGVDIITPDVSEAPTPQNHVISEIEYSPAPITHFPALGAVRDMAGQLLDFYLER